MSLFRLDGFVAFWQVSFFGEMSCVVCREHFVAGLHLSLFVVYFFFKKQYQVCQGMFSGILLWFSNNSIICQ